MRDEANIFAAPNDPADWPAWRDAITRIATQRWRRRIWRFRCHGAFQRRGIKVYFTYYPWESGSGPEAIKSVIAIVERYSFDAVFLDFSKEASSRLRAAFDTIDPAIPIECESPVRLAGENVLE
ncbi:hypothetical protein [Pelagibacterium sp.]|uniref:hypothetical protein n=1 Tax=Pelagibacterium sp. TaxID=1967288 RepID=UPI003A934397